MTPGVLLRLTACVVMLHGYANVSSEEAGGGYGENDASGFPSVPDLAGQSRESKDVERVAGGGDRTVEGDGKGSWISVPGDGGATVPVVERTGEAADEAGEGSAKPGECVGRRFKKCR